MDKFQRRVALSTGQVVRVLAIACAIPVLFALSAAAAQPEREVPSAFDSPQSAPSADDLERKFIGISEQLKTIQERLAPPKQPSLMARFGAFLGRLWESIFFQFIWTLIGSDGSPGGVFAVLATVLSALVAGVRVGVKIFGSNMSDLWKARLTAFVLAYALLGVPAILIIGVNRANPPLADFTVASRELSGLIEQIKQLPPANQVGPVLALAPVEQRLTAIETSIDSLRRERSSGWFQGFLLLMILCGVGALTFKAWN